jgi:hypothetical protein
MLKITVQTGIQKNFFLHEIDSLQLTYIMFLLLNIDNLKKNTQLILLMRPARTKISLRWTHRLD